MNGGQNGGRCFNRTAGKSLEKTGTPQWKKRLPPREGV